jgi:CubicO group peptidase (beta-lactamase class C family)
MKTKTLLSVLLILFIVSSASLYAQTNETSKSKKIDQFLSSFNKLNKFNGTALVAEGGKVIFKKGFGYANMEFKVPNTPDTKIQLASISKTFTAVLIMKLIEEGKLTLDTKISTLLPWYKKEMGDKVTVRHLLNHSSGIRNYFQANGINGPMKFAERIGLSPIKLEEFGKNYCQESFDFEPGSKWSYNNSGYYLLGMIIEKLTGRPYARALKERILDPAVMTSSGDLAFSQSELIPGLAEGYMKGVNGYIHGPYWNMSTAYAAGSLYSTASDLFLFDRALTKDSFISKSSRDSMFSVSIKNWGLGWEIRDIPIGSNKKVKHVVTHEGFLYAWHTRFYRIPEDNICIVLLSNAGDSPLEVMFAGITDIIYGRNPEFPKKSAAELFDAVYKQSGIKEAIEKLNSTKQTKLKEFDFSEQELNRLGYRILPSKPNDAVQLFKLILEIYPNSSNAWDSYGEGLLASGQKENAIKAYEKAVQLNPQNSSSVEALKKLKN